MGVAMGEVSQCGSAGGEGREGGTGWAGSVKSASSSTEATRISVPMELPPRVDVCQLLARGTVRLSSPLARDQRAGGNPKLLAECGASLAGLGVVGFADPRNTLPYIVMLTLKRTIKTNEIFLTRYNT